MSEALKQLQSALAPASGLQRVPMSLESYMHPSPPLSWKRLVNMYAEPEPADARNVRALVPTPGMTVQHVVGDGPIVAMNSDLPGRLYVVSGDHAYRLWYPDPGTLTGVLIEDLGFVGVPGPDAAGGDSLFVTIAVGTTGVAIVVPPNAFVSNHEDALNQVDDAAFPGATSVAYLDGYYVFTNILDGAGWFYSKLLDPLSYSALDFAFADATPNVIRRVIAHRGQLWFLGESAIEIWYNAGIVQGLDIPFRRADGGVIWKGVLNAETVAVAGGSVWWVGHDLIVYRSQGYLPKQVSTPAVEDWLKRNGITGQRRSALTFSALGHTFYCFTSGNRTLCYDTTTEVWHDRTSAQSAADINSTPWRMRTVASATALLLFGDGLSGKIFTPVAGSPLEDGVEVIRQAAMPHLGSWLSRAGPGRRVFCARIEIEMEVGSEHAPRNVLLEWSDNGGWTWTGSRLMDAGAWNAVTKRVYATRLGSFRTRMFRLTMSGMPTVYGFDADLAPGNS